jgi:hypothetical protein
MVERLTERFAIYEVLHAALDFTKETLASTAAFEDMSLATGVTTDGLQQLAYVGANYGVGIDMMSRAIEQFSAKLANGDKNATSAVQELGLNVKSLIASGPQEAFLQFADAAGRIEDPMSKGGIAAEALGGKLAKTLLPALGDLRTKMNEVPKDAIISEATIKSAHDFEVGLEHLETRLKSWTVTAISAVHNGWLVIGDAITNQRTLLPDEAAMVDKVTESLKAQVSAAGPVLSNADLLKNKISALNADAIAPLDATQKANILTLKSYGESITEIAKDVGSNAVAVKLFIDAHTKAEEQAKKSAEAMKKLAAEVDNLASRMKVTSGVSAEFLNTLDGLSKGAVADLEQITGAKMQTQVTSLQEAYDHLTRFGMQPTTAELQKMADMAGELMKKGADLSPELADLAVRFGALDPKMVPVSQLMGEIGGKIKLTIPETLKLRDSLVLLERGFADLGTAIHSLSPDIGTAIIDFAHMFKAIDDSEKAFTNMKKAFSVGDMLSGISSLASGIGGIVAAAIDAGKAISGLWNHFFGSSGRDAVVAFAQSFGGFDQLQKKLETLGAAGQQMWIKLTQQVGRNDLAAAQAEIAVITAALAGQDAYLQRLPNEMQKYGLTWEQAGHQAEQAHLDEIAKGLIQDFADLTKGGFDVSTVTKAMSSSIDDYIHEALRTGTEVPAAMKPLLQKMIDMGTLTDDAGNQITDLSASGISFAETLTEGFQSVVDAINQMTEALTGNKPGSLINSLNTIGGVVVHPKIQPTYDGSGMPSDWPGSGGGASYGGPQASGGDYYVTKPTYFLAGEAGPENVSFGGAHGSRSSASPRLLQPIVVQVGQRQLIQAVIEVAHATKAA